jgi:ribose transport system ATP-binding protein
MTAADGPTAPGRKSALERAPVLELTGVTKSFGPLVAVDNLSLTIGPNEVVGLLGENGAGKSTLLKILTGVHQPDKGSIAVNGKKVNLRSPQEANAVGIGIVHQEQSLFTNLSVAENIVMGLSKTGARSTRFGIYRWGQLNRDAASILERIGSRIDPRTMMSDLSFAHRQMVEIGRTIEIARETTRALNASNADHGTPLVILDEPTSVLERNETEILEREIRKLKEIGSIIFVSHRLEEVLRICDRLVVMRHGRLVTDRPVGNITEDELFELMIGQGARSKTSASARTGAPAKAVLTVDHLSLRHAFHEVSFTVLQSRVTAIVGTVGSGREEVCRALFGAEAFDSGAITVDGAPVRDWSVRKAIAAGIGYLPSERGVESVIGGLSAARNLTLTYPNKTRVGAWLSPAIRNRLAKLWFERLDVRPREIGLELERFSGGNQQKVALAKWLIEGDLKVLILDHPLRGLDPGASEAVNELIREACRGGTAIILLADTLEEALDLGDEILVMRDGYVTARFDMARETPTSLDLLEKMV